jgi:WD40 repeat protein
VSFSPFYGDEQLIVAATTDRSLMFWKKAQDTNWERLNTRTAIGEHTESIYKVSFSPNGEMIASASGDGTIKLWDRYGNLISTMRGGSVPLLSVNFSPDDQTLVATDNANRVIFWKLDTSEFNNIDYLLKQICSQFSNYLKYNPTVDKTDQGLCDKNEPDLDF